MIYVTQNVTAITIYPMFSQQEILNSTIKKAIRMLRIAVSGYWPYFVIGIS